jgi:hypothetical protein
MLPTHERGIPQILTALAALAIAASLASSAHALTACTAADVTAQDSGCPANAGPCSITRPFDVGDGCTLDFQTRDVTVGGNGQFDVGSGIMTIKAGSLTVAVGGRLFGIGNGTTPPTNRGGMVTIQTTGAMTIEKSGTAVGEIDVSGSAQGGTVRIEAGGTVTIAGRLQADNTSVIGAGGNVVIRSGLDIVTLPGSTLSARGGTQAFGGLVDLLATGRVDLGELLDVTGGEGGALDVTAGTEAVIDDVDSIGNGDAGSGGCVSLVGGTVRILGQLRVRGSGSAVDSGGGCGGFVCVESRAGDVTVAGNVLAEGADPDGGGGSTSLIARRSIDVQPGGIISARANGQQGCGGDMALETQLDVTNAGLLDASGGLGGGSIDVLTGRHAIIGGELDVRGRDPGGIAGAVAVTAGTRGPGNVSVTDTIDARGAGCDVFGFCGAGGTVELNGCDVTVDATASLLAGGPAGGLTMLTARELLTVNGSIDALMTTAAGTNGSNLASHPTRKQPLIAPNRVFPAPSVTARPTCTAALEPTCLVPCPGCGNGMVEFPESCDTPGIPAQSCDGCSAVCQTENCNDGLVCTLDTCDALLGCANTPIPGCSTTTTTSTSTSTTSSSSTSSSTSSTTSTSRTTTSTSTSRTTTTTSTSLPPSTTTTSLPGTTTSTVAPTTTSTVQTSTSTSTSSSSSTSTPSTSTSTSTSVPTSTSTSTSIPAASTTLPPPPTTTTSLPPSSRCVPPSCEDGDPCSVDACEAEGCRHTPVGGVEAARCVFQGGGLRAPVCGTIPAAVEKKFAQARGQVERAIAAGGGKRAKAALKRSTRALKQAGNGVTKAARKGAVSGECAASLQGRIADAAARVGKLLSEL